MDSLSIQVEGRATTSLTLNQQLEMIKVSEKHMPKSKTGQELVPMH